MHFKVVREPDAPRNGRRLLLDADDKHASVGTVAHAGDDTYLMKASSWHLEGLHIEHLCNGRTVWAHLLIQIDEIQLGFWLPEELNHYCEVFAMKPFPTAHTLVAGDKFETRLNSHWLSRLPVKAKSAKFRKRFLSYVEQEPEELTRFREFYT